MKLSKNLYYKISDGREIYIYEIIEKNGLQYIFGKVKKNINDSDYVLCKCINNNLKLLESLEELYDIVFEFTKIIPKTSDCLEWVSNLIEFQNNN